MKIIDVVLNGVATRIRVPDDDPRASGASESPPPAETKKRSPRTASTKKKGVRG